MFSFLQKKCREPELNLKVVKERFTETLEVGDPKEELELIRKRAALYGCEEQAIKLIDNRLEQIKATEQSREIGYPLIDMSFLRRRRKQRNIPFPVPLFAVFSLDSSESNIMCTTSSFSFFPTVASDIGYGHHTDMVEVCKEYVSRQGLARLDLNAEFTGIIPKTTKVKIKEAEKQFDEVALVCEIPRWELKETARPDPDPLVIGIKYFTKGNRYVHGRKNRCYLVDTFDITPAEDYLVREFTT